MTIDPHLEDWGEESGGFGVDNKGWSPDSITWLEKIPAENGDRIRLLFVG